jgi:N-methylhydantoinase B
MNIQAAKSDYQDTFNAIDLEILWKRLISIVDEASSTFVRTCFSTLVRDANDFAVVLTDEQGRAIAQSTMSIPSFIGSLPATVKYMINHFGRDKIAEGDVFITNDPWNGTGHIHDVSTVMPIFLEGKLIGFAAVCSHLPDIGGRIRSNSCREIYEEGLQIPPTKLLSRGVANETLVDIITQNIRVPEQGMGDIWAQVAACNMLGDRLKPLAKKLNFQKLGLAVIERSAKAMEEAIARLPDGVYESETEHDGFDERIKIKCKLTVAGNKIHIDYAGSSAQQQRAVNVVPIYAFAYSAYPLKALLCPDLPNNEGSFEAITTSAPTGSILNPVFPAPSGGRQAVGHLLPAAIFKALSSVLKERIWASGSANNSVTMTGKCDGRSFTMVSFVNGGQGATAQRAGYSGLAFPGNLGNTPIEVMETMAPIRIISRSVRKDSGGGGAQHGGNGLRLEFEITEAAESLMASFLMTRMKAAPEGLFGGSPGSNARLLINGKDVDPTEPKQLKPGDRVLMETAGGGGFGPQVK